MHLAKRLTPIFASLLSLGGMVSATPARQAQDLFKSANTFTIDFDTLPVGAHAFGLTLEQGITGTGLSSLLGSNENIVHVSGQRLDREGDSNRAMIYDGECGGDANACSGKNDGGHLYHAGEGNLLIVSQNNDSSNPDDNFEGGHLTFDFSAFGQGTVTVRSLEVVNSRGQGAVIELYADGKRLAEVDMPKSRDETTLDLIEINVAGVDFMRVTARGQFALNDISFSAP